MRAAVLTDTHGFEVAEVPDPSPGPGELVLRVDACGICDSNCCSGCLETVREDERICTRCFDVCAQCGTRVWTKRNDGYGFGLPLAAFDNPNAFTPTDHIFIAEKAHWLKLDDGLPQHRSESRAA